MKFTVLLLALFCATTIAADNAVIAPQSTASPKLQAPSLGTEAIAIPQMLSYQGRLTDTLGAPAPNSSYPIVFLLYTISSGGSPFWSESQSVTTKDGLFSVLLGSVTPIGSVPDAGTVYLAMTVSGGPELTPRIRIASAAYSYLAVRAANSDLLQGKDTTALDSRYVNEGQASSVTSNMIVDGTIAAVDLNQMGATSGQVIKWTGSAWAPGNDSVGTGGSGTVRKVFQSTGVVLSPNPITDSGTVRFDSTWGDARFVNESQAAGGGLTGTYPSPTIANNAVGSAQITDGSVTSADIRDTTVNTADLKDAAVTAPKLNQMGASSGQVMKWTGSAWAPRNDSLGGGAGDSAWVRSGSDSVLYTIRQLGIARGGASNMLHGTNRFTHVNLGVACTTGLSGQNSIYATVGGGWGNAASGDLATVGGGRRNTASGQRSVVCGGDSIVAAGSFNSIGGGYVNRTSGDYSTVAGGHQNIADFTGATVAGGVRGSASSNYASVGGGYQNSVGALYGTVCGGGDNRVASAFGTVGGGNSSNVLGDYATIAGGSTDSAVGDFSAALSGYLNKAGGVKADTASVIAGGQRNRAAAKFAFVGGGKRNRASGIYSVVVGGDTNAAGGSLSLVGGGSSNNASGVCATVAGGVANTASGSSSVVAGGESNTASGQWSAACGGTRNIASGYGATVAGGYMDSASGTYSTVGGGSINRVRADYATVSGGYSNVVAGLAGGILSGMTNVAGDAADDTATVIAGGWNNSATGKYDFVGGGYQNNASSNYSTIAGGRLNTASGSQATVGGGYNNSAGNSNSTVGGGDHNSASGANSTVTGGYYGGVSGNYSTVIGGANDTCAANYALVAGSSVRARAAADYTFAFGEGCTTSVPRAVVFYHSGAATKLGVGVQTPTHYVDVTGGSYCDASGWHNGSSRALKKDVAAMTPEEMRELAAQLEDLDVVRFRYKLQDDEKLHVGVIAEDAPDVLVSAKHDALSTGDAIGFLLAVAKAQQAEIEQLKAEMAKQKR